MIEKIIIKDKNNERYQIVGIKNMAKEISVTQENTNKYYEQIIKINIFTNENSGMILDNIVIYTDNRINPEIKIPIYITM